MATKFRKKVLFICTHNSARSQMAEAILRHMYGNYYIAYSAGTEPTHIHPKTIAVMKEVNIDISRQKAKNIAIYKNRRFDYVITVCDKAQETCPYFPGAKATIHRSFKNPVNHNSSHKNSIENFRKVRNNIFQWIQDFFKTEI